MFTTLLVVVGALFVAVLGRAILDPWPSPASPKSDGQSADEGAGIMEAIALSCF